MNKQDDQQYGPQETQQRLNKTLRAAFSMKPTPLKAIPKKHGKVRPTHTGRKAKQST